ACARWHPGSSHTVARPAARPLRTGWRLPHRAGRPAIAADDYAEQTMNGAQVSAFQVNSGIAPSAMATVLVGVVFAVLLVWGVWAIRTAYVGWAENRLNQRQFLGVCIRFVAMYLVLTFFLLS